MSDNKWRLPTQMEMRSLHYSKKDKRPDDVKLGQGFWCSDPSKTFSGVRAIVIFAHCCETHDRIQPSMESLKLVRTQGDVLEWTKAMNKIYTYEAATTLVGKDLHFHVHNTSQALC